VINMRGGPAPSRLDQYSFFQFVVGAFPYEGVRSADARDTFTARLVAHMAKAAREAKLRTSWLAPDRDYDSAMTRFVQAAIADDAFVQEVESFVRSIAPHGATNSLAQLALRFASPGVPDLYQGNELWDLSLVDPDNRRPVSFARRREQLDSLIKLPVSRALAEELVGSYEDGRIKMHVTRIALGMRRREPALFLEGAYRPITVTSPHVIAFERTIGTSRLVAVAPRLTRRLLGRPGFALGEAWGDQTLDVGTEAEWENAFTGERFAGRTLSLGDLLQAFPVAWLRAGEA
jgi:(1->4)-alpha-D-glucan 1-alpha-D-glucosylmutase